MLLAAFLFIYDASHLLGMNEAIVSPGKDGWQVSTGKNWLSIRGRNWVAPNLLLLHHPAYKLAWDDEQVYIDQRPDLKARLPGQMWLALLAYVSWITTFIALPLVLFFYRTDAAALSCAASIYLFAILAGVRIWMRRTSLGLTDSQAKKLAAELIFCPVFTANVVRRISHCRPITCNLVAAAAQLLPGERWEAFKTELLDYLDLEIDAADTDSRRAANLQQTQKTILGMRLQ